MLVSQQFFGLPPTVVAHGPCAAHSDTSMARQKWFVCRSDVRAVPTFAAKRRGSLGRAWGRHQHETIRFWWNRVGRFSRQRSERSELRICAASSSCAGIWMRCLWRSTASFATLAGYRSQRQGFGNGGRREAGQGCGAQTHDSWY